MDKKREALITKHLPLGYIELDGVGLVQVRGLSRGEVARMPDDDGDGLLREQYILARGMVDPLLSEADVAHWQEAGGTDEITKVLSKVAELSGMKSNAAKETTRELLSDPDATFRDAPSPEAGHDGRPAPSGDVSG